MNPQASDQNRSNLPEGMVLILGEHTPEIDPSVFIAPTACVIGAVRIEADASIWFGAVLRGDDAPIHIGRRSNLQDGVIVHGDEGQEVVVGDDVTIGHGAIIHGCRIEDGALIGMGAVVLDGAVIESGAFIAAGAVVGPGKRVAANTLWAGVPAKPIRELPAPAEGENALIKSAEHYRIQALRYRSGQVRRYSVATSVAAKGT